LLIVNKTNKKKLSSAFCNTIQRFGVGNIVKNIPLKVSCQLIYNNSTHQWPSDSLLSSHYIPKSVVAAKTVIYPNADETMGWFDDYQRMEFTATHDVTQHHTSGFGRQFHNSILRH